MESLRKGYWIRPIGNDFLFVSKGWDGSHCGIVIKVYCSALIGDDDGHDGWDVQRSSIWKCNIAAESDGVNTLDCKG